MSKFEGHDAKIGTTVLGRYVLEALVGVGSFAVAYRARDTSDGSVVAVKIAHADLMQGPIGEVVRLRFETEANALAGISHPSLVGVFDSGETADGLPAIAMEYLDGVTLESVLDQRAPLPADEVLMIVGAIASVLTEVHLQDVVHRDVTPANVMLCRASAGAPPTIPKLLDFGIAKVSGGPDITIGAIGTPRYLSKEQIRGEPTTLSDVYSLGATLWWAVTGEEFLADLEVVGEILEAHLSMTTPVDVRDMFPTMPDAMASLLAAMLHPQLTQRIDAKTVAAQLPAAMASIAAMSGKVTRSSPTLRTLRKPDLLVPTCGTGEGNDPIQLGSLRKPIVVLVGAPGPTQEALVSALGEDVRAVALATADKAVEYIDGHAVDLAIVSARLGDGSGYQLVSRLRAGKGAGKMLRVVMTAPHADPFRLWRRVGANMHLKVEGPADSGTVAEMVLELAATQDVRLDEGALDQLFSLGGRHARRAMERFLAETPVWLQTLETGEGLERLETLAYLGAAIASRARVLGAFELTGAARRMGHSVLGPGQLKSLVRELTQAQDAVRHLYMRMFATQ